MKHQAKMFSYFAHFRSSARANAGGCLPILLTLQLLGGCAASGPSGPSPIQVTAKVTESEGVHAGAHLKLSLGAALTVPPVGQACTLTKVLGKVQVSELLPWVVTNAHVGAGRCEVTEIIRSPTRLLSADGSSEYHFHSAVVRITREGLVSELDAGSEVILAWLPSPTAQEPPAAHESATDATEGASVGSDADASQPTPAATQTANREPIPLLKVSPVYPEKAQRKGIQGYVRLTHCVSSSGDVENVRVVESAPPGLFEHAAVQATYKGRYQPKLVAGQPVEACGIENTVTFQLGR